MNKKLLKTGIMKNVFGNIVIFSCLLLLPDLVSANQLITNAKNQISVEQTSKTISLNLKNASIKSIFFEIKKQTKLNFIYKDELIKGFALKTISVKNASVTVVLDELFSGSEFSYKINGNSILIVKKPTQGAASNVPGIISGRVLDRYKNPIPGVNVIIKGQQLGTSTDANGKFTLKARGEQELEFSFIGMKTQSKRVATGVNNLVVTLEENSVEVEDIVITGVFNKPKESYTGATTFISKKELTDFKSRNLLRTIANIDPAFNIVSNNKQGSNPNALPEINIRGTTSLPVVQGLEEIEGDLNDFQTEQRANLNTPLFILDGFEITLERMMDLDPEEIENVTILKDAGSTAIYGSRGSNGVVVITSVKPKEGKLRVSVRGSLNLEIPDLTSYDVLNAREKLELEVLAGLYIPKVSETSPDYINTQEYMKDVYNSKLRNILNGVDTYWLSQPLATGISGNYGLSLSGGDQAFRYALSASYSGTKGIMKGSDRNNTNASLNLTYLYNQLQFSNVVSVGLNDASNSLYGSYSTFASLNPYQSPYDANGEISPRFTTLGEENKMINPLYDATTSSFSNSNYLALRNNTSIEWTPIKALKIGAQLGISVTTNENHNFKSATHSEFLEEKDPNNKGSYGFTTGRNNVFNGSLTASYAEVFGKHSIFAGLNGTINQTKRVSYSILTQGFSHDNLNFLSMASKYKGDSPSGSESTSRSVGLMANINYNYNHALFIDASYRIDGASTFGTYSRFKPFYTVGGGWNVTSMKFVKEKLKFVSNLRLRYNYGVTGSLPFQVYDAITTFEYRTDDRYAGLIGALIKGYGNPNLTWQYTYSHSVGTDVSLFNNKVSFGFNFYKKLTKGSITTVNLPLSHGFDKYTENKGDIQNQGYDFNVSIRLINDYKRQINWSVRASFARNDNKLVRLSSAMKEYSEKLQIRSNSNNQTPFLLYREGESMDAMYVVKSLGIDPASGRELLLKRDGRVTFTYDPNDKVAIGLKEPKLRGSLSSSFRYKKLSVNISFGLRLGGQLYNSTLVSKVENANVTRNVDRRVFSERWSAVDHHAKYKGFIARSAGGQTSRFMQKESTLKCNTINFDYALSSKWLKNYMKINTIHLGANINDLFQISTVKLERGIDYPFARNIQLQMSISF